MASVNSQQPVSESKKLLDYALGEQRVSLSALLPAEFDDLLSRVLSGVNLRELRGFQPLKELLTIRSHYDGLGHLNINHLSVSDEVVMNCARLDNFDLNSHVISVLWSVGLVLKRLFKRYESGEETTDRDKASSWGQSAYHQSGQQGDLVLRRPRNHTLGNDNLVLIIYQYEKIPLENKHVITKIRATPISVKHFRRWFKDDYPKIAHNIILSLNSAHSRTIDELKSRLSQMQDKGVRLSRLRDSTTE
jgi:hypothetical protein